MARFDGGVFLIDRSAFSKDSQNNVFHGNANMLAVYCLLNSWANYEDKPAPFGAQKIILKRGQIITASNEIENQLGLSRPVVRRILKKLQEFEKIDQQKDQRGTLITILDYVDNQEYIFKKDQQKDQRRTNDGPTQDQRRTNDEPLKKEEKKEEKTKEEFSLPDDPLAAGESQAIIPEVLEPEPNNNLPATIDTPSERKAKERKLVAGLNRAKSASVWEAYAEAYAKLYGARPADNAKVRSQALKLMERLEDGSAAEVARWYVECERGKNGWLLEARHPFDQLLKSVQSYHTAWITQYRITASQAEHIERKETISLTVNRYLEKKKGKSEYREERP